MSAKRDHSDAPTIIFAGGGSGGHISPGLAIAERLRELEPRAKAIFICSTRAIDAAMLSDAGEESFAVPATPPSMRPFAAMRFIRNFRASVKRVKAIIAERSVDHVVLLGGFVAAPCAKAARAMGVPVMLVNLDAPPGRANRWMARRSDVVLTAIPLPTMPGFASEVVGMPIRQRTIATCSAEECRRQLDLDPHRRTLLVTGASQGATSINAFMLELARCEPRLFDGWQILHLAGHGADESLRAGYSAVGVSAVVLSFLNDMGLAWGAAELAISRAGASSVAEAAANAVPTLFLPYPYHKDMHQRFNAQPLVDVGGAAMAIDCIDAAANVREIGPTLRALMNDASRRASMRATLQRHPMPDAARTIAQRLIGNKT